MAGGDLPASEARLAARRANRARERLPACCRAQKSKPAALYRTKRTIRRRLCASSHVCAVNSAAARRLLRDDHQGFRRAFRGQRPFVGRTHSSVWDLLSWRTSPPSGQTRPPRYSQPSTFPPPTSLFGDAMIKARDVSVEELSLLEARVKCRLDGPRPPAAPFAAGLGVDSARVERELLRQAACAARRDGTLGTSDPGQRDRSRIES